MLGTKTIGRTVDFGLGYVVGTRAGRERYDQIQQAARTAGGLVLRVDGEVVLVDDDHLGTAAGARLPARARQELTAGRRLAEAELAAIDERRGNGVRRRSARAAAGPPAAISASWGMRAPRRGVDSEATTGPDRGRHEVHPR